MTTTEVLSRIIDRELQSLEDQVGAYNDPDDMWKVVPGITNSGATLALHLCGNLRHFIGAVYGDSGYVRDRTAEFAGEKVDASEVTSIIRSTREEISDALDSVSDETLDEQYPLTFGDNEFALTGRLFLVHLVSHLGYHLGQIDYHRRIVTHENRSVRTVSIARLF